MKKIYSKPEIMFESFTLSENIAGDCDTRINNSTEDVCAYITRTGLNVFMSSINACTTHEDDGDYNGICYHNPIDTKNLFHS